MAGLAESAADRSFVRFFREPARSGVAVIAGIAIAAGMAGGVVVIIRIIRTRLRGGIILALLDQVAGLMKIGGAHGDKLPGDGVIHALLAVDPDGWRGGGRGGVSG